MNAKGTETGMDPGSRTTHDTLSHGIPIIEAIATSARHRPDREAFVFLSGPDLREDRLTWGDLDTRARRGSPLVREMAGESPVLLMMKSDAESITALVTCLYAGVPCAPIPVLTRNGSAERIQAIARSSGAQAVIAPRTADCTTALPGLRRIDLDIAPDGPGHCGPFEPGPTAIIQYTSGSTNEPKGVALSHDNITANLEMLRVAFGVTQDSRFLSWLPLFHDMGLAQALMPLYFGVPGVLMPPLSFVQQPLRWLKALDDHSATITGAPNFAYEACLRRLSDEDVAGLDLSRCELAFCGAEPVRLSTMQGFARRFASTGFRASALYPCYGMAEATVFVSGGRLFADASVPSEASEDANRVAPCGGAAEGCTIDIVDPAGRRRLPDGEVGEVWIRGPHIASGYWNDPEATELAFNAALVDDPGKGFLRSGDLGRMDQGRLTLTGRVKDVIICRGANLHAADIEASVARAHPSFSDIGAAFAWEADGAETVVLVHEAARHVGMLDGGAMMKAALDAVAYHHGARLFDLVIVKPGRVPRTTSGKVRRAEARDFYAAERFERLVDGGYPSLGRNQ